MFFILFYLLFFKYIKKQQLENTINLNIALTKRANGAASTVPLAGFRYHALDQHVHKLLSSGYKVALCEQVEDPKLSKGIVKREIALHGLSKLKKNCHCVIELDNENLNELTHGDIPMKKALDIMSDLVARTVGSLSEVITEPSTINVDFADLRKVIETGGQAKVLYGESDNSDPGSVLDSLLGNPLLGSHYQGAEAVLLHITAKDEFTLNNCHEVLAALKLELSEDVNLIWGHRTDNSMDAKVKVVMLVAGIPESNLDLEKKSDLSESLLGDKVQMID